MKVGDVVDYFSLKDDAEPSHRGVIECVLKEGIPSCQQFMLKVEGKPGFVLASHCQVVAVSSQEGDK
jgi:hypothetical protein